MSLEPLAPPPLPDQGSQADPRADEKKAAAEAAAFHDAAALVKLLQEEISRAVIRQDAVVSQILTALLAGGNILIEGVPGLGKTLIVLALARTFGGTFTRVQFTPDLMPTDVTGHAVFDAKTGEFRIRRGPAFTNLLLADEVNRARQDPSRAP